MIRTLLKTHPLLWRTAHDLRQKLGGRVEREVDLLEHLVLPGRTAVDVGGNTGAYCEKLVGLTDKVVVIEAQPELAKHLNWMFQGKARVIHAAASDAPGEVVLRIPDQASLGGLATVSTHNPLETSAGITVQAVTLDGLDLHDVGFIKIDVEGHEAEVLKGATGLIARDRPSLLIEAEERHRTGAVAHVRDILDPLGYAGFLLRRGVLTSISSFDPVVDQALPPGGGAALDAGHVPASYVNNFVFLPL